MIRDGKEVDGVVAYSVTFRLINHDSCKVASNLRLNGVEIYHEAGPLIHDTTSEGKIG